MGNKGSKGARSMRPPIKSDSRGFKFGQYSNGGRDAGKSAPAAPSYQSQGGAAYPPAAPQQQQQYQQQPPAQQQQTTPSQSGDEAECAFVSGCIFDVVSVRDTDVCVMIL